MSNTPTSISLFQNWFGPKGLYQDELAVLFINDYVLHHRETIDIMMMSKNYKIYLNMPAGSSDQGAQLQGDITGKIISYFLDKQSL